MRVNITPGNTELYAVGNPKITHITAIYSCSYYTEIMDIDIYIDNLFRFKHNAHNLNRKGNNNEDKKISIQYVHTVLVLYLAGYQYSTNALFKG